MNSSEALLGLLNNHRRTNEGNQDSMREHDVRQHNVRQHDVRQHDVRQHDVRQHDVRQHDVRQHDVRQHDVKEHDVREHDVREHDVREHDVIDTPHRRYGVIGWRHLAAVTAAGGSGSDHQMGQVPRKHEGGGGAKFERRYGPALGACPLPPVHWRINEKIYTRHLIKISM